MNYFSSRELDDAWLHVLLGYLGECHSLPAGRLDSRGAWKLG